MVSLVLGDHVVVAAAAAVFASTSTVQRAFDNSMSWGVPTHFSALYWGFTYYTTWYSDLVEQYVGLIVGDSHIYEMVKQWGQQ